MDATIRATCPQCHSALKIPAQWAGQAVKCKKCGAVVRTKARAAGTAASAALDKTTVAGPTPFAGMSAAPVPTPPAYNPLDNGPALYQPAAYDTKGFTPHTPYGDPPVAPAYPYPAPAAAYPAAGYPALQYSYPAPGGYAHPAPAYPPPQPPAAALSLEPTFADSEATQAYKGRGRKYRRGGGKGKYLWIGFALLLTGGLVYGTIYALPLIKEKFGAQVADGTGTPAEKDGGTVAKGGDSKTGATGGAFPRRLLFIHVSNYLYLNPLTASADAGGNNKGGDKTRASALRLAYEWRVPTEKDNNQVFLLSDTAPAPDTRPPFKSVLTGTYEKFFDTSRAQDRIVVYFGGHVLSKKVGDADVVFLVPIEGDPDDEATLVPLADFYDKLKACKATQKVVIWDVCRFNPDRGRQRPGSEPMSEEVAAKLAAAPAGVQVVTTCAAGENALEFNFFTPDGKSPVGGSNFLEAGRYVNEKNKVGAKSLTPGDPLPVDAWATASAKRASEVAVAFDAKMKQTVKVSGGPPESLTAAKADEPPAAKFDYPTPPKGAPKAEVGSVTAELALPGIKDTNADVAIGDFPFPEAILRPYKTDVSIDEIMKKENRDKYLLRVNVVEAYDTIRKVWGGDGKEGKSLRTEFVDKSTEAVKKRVLEEQLYPAEAIPKLDRAILLLEAVEPKRAEEPKRWQAHYDYVLAQCKARLAFMHEYNLALGGIRTDVLPALKPEKGEDGYRLVSTEKMRIKTEKKYADEAKELFQKIVDEHKGTPWAIMAKRDKSMILGLAWQPFNSGAEDKKKE